MASLQELDRVHDALTELLLLHRDSVVGLDFKEARERLARFERELRRHMEDEETLLLPLYEARVAPVRGADADALRLEHRSILRALGEVALRVGKLAEDSSAGRREAHLLLDAEGLLLHLLDHHDRRERATLYPLLDQALTEPERADLLARCRRPL